MIFLLKYWRHIGLVMLALAAFVWLQIHDARIRKAERQACQLAQAQSDIEGVKQNEKVADEVRRLSDPDLDRQLIDHWLR